MKDPNQERLDGEMTQRPDGRSMRTCPGCGFHVDQSVTICPRDGTHLAAPVSQDPAFMGKYEFIETIGSGGMGVIYKARHVVLNKVVAIKMVHAHLLNDEIMRRFQLEGRAVNSLSHPNIITVNDFGVTDSGQPYLIMEYIEGRTLSSVFDNEGRFKTKRFCRVFAQVASALAHAHKRGVLHRDIKPSNIMLVDSIDGPDQVKVMDFGIAKVLSDTEHGAQNLTKTGDALGSPLYMSPEQCLGRSHEVTNLSDVYSLGCVMYEALTGTAPFEGNNVLETMQMHISDAPLPLKEATLGETFDPILERVVMKTLEKDPANRYQSMGQLEQDLLNVDNPNTRDLVSVRAAEAAAAPSKKSGLLNNGLIALVSVAVVVCAGVAFYTVQHQAAKPKPAEVPDNSYEFMPLQAKDNSSAVTEKEMVASMVQGNRKSLDLSRGGLIPLNDSDFEPLKNATNCEEMNLSKTGISDKGLEYISKLRLNALYLTNTAVKDLHAIKGMNSLGGLGVGGTSLNEEGLKVILGLPLGWIDLSSTGISDSDLLKLTKIKTLRNLSVQDCTRLTTAGINRFKQKAPLVNVILPSGEGESYSRVMGQAKRQFAEKKFVEAENLAKQAIDIEEAGSKKNPEFVADALSFRADCFLQQKHYVEAEKLKLEAIRTVERLNVRHESIPEYEAQLAGIQELSGRIKQAIETRLKADQFLQYQEPPEEDELKKWRKRFLDNSMHIAEDYILIKKIDKGMTAFKRTLALCDKYNESDSQVAAIANQWYAGNLLNLGKAQEAIPHFQKAIEIYKTDPMFNFVLPDANLQLLNCYVSTKHYSEAEDLCRSLLDQPADIKHRKVQYAFLIQALQKQNKRLEATEATAKLKALN